MSDTTYYFMQLAYCTWLRPSQAPPPPCSPRAGAAAACQAHSQRPFLSPTRPTVRPTHKGAAREQERLSANGYVRGGCVRKCGYTRLDTVD